MRTSSISRPSEAASGRSWSRTSRIIVGALLGKGGLEAAQAVDAAQRGIETRAQAQFGQLDLAGHGLAELAWIADAVGDEGVDLVELAARDLDADVVQVEAHHAVLDDLDVVGLEEAERRLEVDARLGLDVDDLAEAEHDRLLALVDDEDRGPDQEENDGDDDADDGETVGHGFCPSAGATFLQLGQRQVRDDALAVALFDDHLVGVLEHLLHRLEIEPLARHVGRLGIFVVDRDEALGLALRLLHDAVLVGGGLFADLRGIAARLAELLVGILVGLLDELVLVLLGALHLVEGVGHFARRRGVLDRDGVDGEPGAIFVERSLQDFAHVLGDALAIVAEDVLGRPAADRLRAWRSRPPGAACCQGRRR